MRQYLKIMHILTGSSGYLLRHLLTRIPLEGYCYHFGCPIDSSTEHNRNMLKKHIEDTKELVKECRTNNLKLVYASSCEVYMPTDDTQYRTTKIFAESLLDPRKDLIWRIPRVYSSDRDRGLIPQLKAGIMPRPNNVLEWVHVNDFIEDFLRSLDGVGIRAYKGVYRTTKVKDILDTCKFIERDIIP